MRGKTRAQDSTMPRHNLQAAPRFKFSTGVCVMFVGYMHLVGSDVGSVGRDFGLSLMSLGTTLYARELKERRKIKAGGRYGPRGEYAKDRTQAFLDELIEDSTDRFFKSWFRYVHNVYCLLAVYLYQKLCSVNRTSFYRLLELIRPDPVFVSRGRKPQTPVKYQLATYLIRYGALPGVKVATLMQMAEGTIYNHSSRVVRAFRNLRDLYISWPTAEERVTLKETAQEMGFPGAVAVVDGSYLPLLEKPRQNSMAYRTRKKNWAVSLAVSAVLIIPSQ